MRVSHPVHRARRGLAAGRDRLRPTRFATQASTCGAATSCAPGRSSAARSRVSPTWNEGDPGVELVGGDVAIEQLSPVDSADGTCLEFDLIANVDSDAQVTLDIDVFGDGSVEYTETIPTSSWAPLTFKLPIRGPYGGVRFELAKRGSGRAVLAQIGAKIADDCAGIPADHPGARAARRAVRRHQRLRARQLPAGLLRRSVRRVHRRRRARPARPVAPAIRPRRCASCRARASPTRAARSASSACTTASARAGSATSATTSPRSNPAASTATARRAGRAAATVPPARSAPRRGPPPGCTRRSPAHPGNTPARPGLVRHRGRLRVGDLRRHRAQTMRCRRPASARPPRTVRSTGSTTPRALQSASRVEAALILRRRTAPSAPHSCARPSACCAVARMPSISCTRCSPTCSLAGAPPWTSPTSTAPSPTAAATRPRSRHAGAAARARARQRGAGRPGPAR